MEFLFSPGDLLLWGNADESIFLRANREEEARVAASKNPNEMGALTPNAVFLILRVRVLRA